MKSTVEMTVVVLALFVIIAGAIVIADCSDAEATQAGNQESAVADAVSAINPEGTPVASVGGVEYTTLYEAFQEAPDGSTITLIDDVVDSYGVDISDDRELILDMAGHTITYGAQVEGYTVIFDLSGNVKLTIQGNGSFTFNDDYLNDKDPIGYIFRLGGNSTITINDGEYLCGLTCIQLDSNSKATINGGKFSAYGTWGDRYWILNLIDGCDGIFEVKGGTFVNYDPSNSETENPTDNFVAEGYEAISSTEGEDTIWTVRAVTTVDTGTDSDGNITSTVTVPEAEGGKVAVEEDSITKAVNEIKTAVESNPDADKSIVIGIQSSTSVEISVSSISTIVDNTISITVSSNAGTVILEPDVAAHIIQNSSSSDVVAITVAAAELGDMNSAQAEVVGSNPVFDLSLTVGDEYVSNFNGTVTVELGYTIPEDVDPSDIVVFYVDDNGNIEAMPTDCSSGKVVFQTTHFTYYMIGNRSMVDDGGSSSQPSWDDDEDLPPFIPTQPAEDDDTVTIVACAAAAAVAAIMAVFLIIDRKG